MVKSRSKIRNPETGRMVYRSGRIGQRVIDTYYERNDITGRLLRIDSRTHQRYVASRERLQSRRSGVLDNLINGNQFQSILNHVVNGDGVLTEEQAESFYFNLLQTGNRYNIAIHVGGQVLYRGIGPIMKDWIIHILMNGCISQGDIGFGSDGIDNIDITSINRLVLVQRENRNMFRDKAGAYFGYINTTENIDLSRYQIFTPEQAYDKNNIIKDEQCLLHTLRLYGVHESTISRIKSHFVMRTRDSEEYQKIGSIRRTDLNDVCKIILKNIRLHYFTPKGIHLSTEHKYNDDNEFIEIALYKSHYFVYENTIYSTCSINKYDMVKNIEDYHKIKTVIKKNKNGSYHVERYKGNYRKLTSLFLMQKLFKGGHFKKLDLTKFIQNIDDDSITDNIYLNVAKMEQKAVKKKIMKDKKDRDVYYADTEAFTSGIDHELFKIGFGCMKYKTVSVYSVLDARHRNAKCPRQSMLNMFLNEITKGKRRNVLCYFHNLKYDACLFEKYIPNIYNPVKRGGRVYRLTINYFGVTVDFVDSYALLQFSLDKFNSAFKLSDKCNKIQTIAYNYYTRDNYNNRLDVKEYARLLPNKHKPIFMEEVMKHRTYDYNDNTFSPNEYYNDYLRMDCEVLKQGMNKFRDMMHKITKGKIDIHDYLSISSLTDNYLLELDVYEGVYQMTGNLRDYAARAVHGGRCVVNDKYVKKIIKKRVAPIDANLLYSSAIKRIYDEMGGIPIGMCETFISNEELAKWEEKLYSIVTIKITKIKKKQQLPMIMYRNKDDTITYSNEPRDDKIVVDSVTLQDYIKFHDIEYEIFEGVYWDNGVNPKIGEVIIELANERLKYKAEKNKPMADSIKLMCNSIYGKTIQKRDYTRKKMVPRKRVEDYIDKNWTTIISWRHISDRQTEVTEQRMDLSYNRGHIGCMILSYSKRIMNELIDIGTSNNLDMIYSDTDSLYMYKKDIKKLTKLYKTQYNKDLMGDGLGQFSHDFKMDGVESKDIYATQSIFLGRKSYYCKLKAKDKIGVDAGSTGARNNPTRRGDHVRMKGINKAGLEHKLKEFDGSYLNLYKDLANGEEHEFILNPYDEDENTKKELFIYSSGSVGTRRKEFKRRVQF
jgi:hypothetical protein